MDGDSPRQAVTTVTPTRRLAHWLRERHDDTCIRRGLAVWTTPDILPWSGFIRRLFSSERQVGRLSGHWLSDTAASVLWQRFALGDPVTSALVAPELVGRTAYESWRRMRAYEIPLRALGLDDRPETSAFARWARQYEAWLDAHGAVDESTATASIERGYADRAIELVGFDEFTPAQRSLLDRLERSGTVVTRKTEERRKGSMVRVDCLDRRAELEAAARWAAGRLDRNPAARLAIVVPDLATERDDVRRWIERVLVPTASLAGGPAPESQGFELAAARPLAQQPVIDAALGIIDAFSRACDLVTASRLLRVPFLFGYRDEEDARARCDAFLRRSEGPDLTLARLAHLARAQRCGLFATAIEAGLSLARSWPQRALPSRWSQHWFELLKAIGWPGDGLDSAEHQAHERWQSLLGEVAASDDCVGPLAAGQACVLLRDQADEVLFEPKEVSAGLLVIDADTCAGMSFDALWVCGLDASSWPPAASPDPFLPQEWQARRRVPGATAEIAAAAARTVLERLCRSAEEVVLSVPQFDNDAPLLASSLVADVERSVIGDVWTAPSVAVAGFAARPGLEQLTDSSMPPVVPGARTHGGARLLEIQSACPFRAQAEFRLGARTLEDPELGVAATERGDLVHRVLDRVWNELRDQRTLLRRSADELTTMIRVAITAETGRALHESRGVMRHLLEIEARWLESRVAELLAADRERSPFVVESRESEHSIAIGGLQLSLKVDRIDRLENGGLALIDYKTGADAEPEAWLGERPRLPQLPLYVEAVGPADVAAVVFGRVRTGDTGYTGLARDAESFPGLPSPGGKGWPKEFTSWDDLREAWRRRLLTLASEHAAGDARLAPDPPRACRYCTLHSLCRVVEARADAGEDGDDE